MSHSFTPITSMYDALPEDYQTEMPIGYCPTDTPIRFVKCETCGQNVSISSYERHLQTHKVYKPQLQQQEKFNFQKESELLPPMQCRYAARQKYILDTLIQ